MTTDVHKTNSPMIGIFEESQETSLSHERLCNALLALYRKMPFSHFAEEFFELCRYSLVSGERTPYRERHLDFIVRFVVYVSKHPSSSDADGSVKNLLLVKTFLFCAKYHECISPAPRFRCVQLIQKLLLAMGSEACLPVELFDIIQKVLLRRATDVKHNIRIQAVQGLSRLQNPTDKDCPVVAELMWMARHDNSPEVRRNALAASVLTTVTLSCVVERCRDISNAVRKTAYNILAERSVLRPLSIGKRISIIQEGLTDTSVDVLKAAECLVMAWFKVVEQDPILLLRRLDTEGVPVTSRLCLDHLLPNLDETNLTMVVTKFATNYLDEKHLPKLDRCSVECTFFWRVIAEYLLKRSPNSTPNNEDTANHENGLSPGNFASLLESILPSVSDYVDFVIKRVGNLLELLRDDVDYNENVMESESVLEQVLTFCDSIDLSDEFGRRRLFEVVRDWLISPSVPASLTAPLLQLFFKMESNKLVRVQTVTEMISELLDSAEECSIQTAPIGSNKTTIGTSLVSKLPTPGLGTQVPTQTPITDTGIPPQTRQLLSKTREIFLRIKVAELKVRLNELNDSLGECIRVQDFERASSLRDEGNRLDIERSALLLELTGVPLSTAAPQTFSSTTGNLNNSTLKVDEDENMVPKVVVKEELNVEEDNEEEEDEDDEETSPEIRLVRQQIKYLGRLSLDVVLKANKMVCIMVQKSHSLWTLPPALRSLLYSLVLPSVQHADLAIRNQAISALGLLCTMDWKLSEKYLGLFYAAVKMDHATVGVTAINSIIDSFLIFGFQPFLEVALTLDEVELEINDLILLKGGNTLVENNDPKETANLALRLISPLLNLIQSELPLEPLVKKCEPDSEKVNSAGNLDGDLRTAAGLGLSKLFLFDRIISGQVLSQMLLLWFNPQTSDLPKLGQSLGVFFTDYACSRPERQACVADAVLPTLTRLLSAPASSPLSEIDPGVVISLLVRLTDASCLFPSNGDDSSKPPTQCMENPCHDDLAMRLCNCVLNAPQSAEARIFIRMLSQLHLSFNKPLLYKDLLRMTGLMLKKVERSSHLSLHRFQKNIHGCIESSGLSVDDFNVNEASTMSVVEESLGEENLNGVSTTPSLLGPAMPSSQLVAFDEIPGRRSVSSKEMRNTMAGLSFVGPSVPHKLLVFSDDDNDDDDENNDSVMEVTQTPVPSKTTSKTASAKSTNVRLSTVVKMSPSKIAMPPPTSAVAPRLLRREVKNNAAEENVSQLNVSKAPNVRKPPNVDNAAPTTPLSSLTSPNVRRASLRKTSERKK